MVLGIVNSLDALTSPITSFLFHICTTHTYTKNILFFLTHIYEEYS